MTLASAWAIFSWECNLAGETPELVAAPSRSTMCRQGTGKHWLAAVPTSLDAEKN